MKRISKSKKKTIGTVAISVLVVSIGFGVAFAVSMSQMKSDYNEKVVTLNNDILSNQVQTYVAKENIAAGNEISEETTELRTVYYQGGNSDDLITEEDLGKVAVADISAGKPIYKSMIGEQLETTLRETELACLALNTNLKQDDFVDIRIMYPNGENYIVLSKVCIRKLDLANNDCFLWLNEEQIMSISSAIVDTYMHDGSILYTTKYIEDGQDETSSNYTPTKDCITAMANDENIVNKAENKLNASVREALDSRLSKEKDGDGNVDLKQILPDRSNIQSDEEVTDESGDTVSDDTSGDSNDNSGEETSYGD